MYAHNSSTSIKLLKRTNKVLNGGVKSFLDEHTSCLNIPNTNFNFLVLWTFQKFSGQVSKDITITYFRIVDRYNQKSGLKIELFSDVSKVTSLKNKIESYLKESVKNYENGI